MKTFDELLDTEYKRAIKKHGPFKSDFEFFGVLIQRIEMIKECFSHNRYKLLLSKREILVLSLIQICVLCKRFVEKIDFNQDMLEKIIIASEETVPESE